MVAPRKTRWSCRSEPCGCRALSSPAGRSRTWPASWACTLKACRVLQAPPSTYTPTSTTSLGTRPARRSAQGRDPARMEGELQVYGTHKIWRQL